MGRVFLLVIAVALFPAPDARAGLAFADGDFASWTFSAHFEPPSTLPHDAVARREAGGGHPGAHLTFETRHLGGGGAYAVAVNPDFATTTALAGTAFAVSVDVAYASPTPPGRHNLYVVADQAGALYLLVVGPSSQPSAFTRMTFAGVLDPAAFRSITPGAPPRPLLDGGVPTRFGFAAGSGFYGGRVQVDNLRLDLAALPPDAETSTAVPVLGPASIALLAALLFAAGTAALRAVRQ